MSTAAINDLHPIGAKMSALDDQDTECLAAVRDVLAQYDRLNRFGVTLLHKHFDLRPNERLIETTDIENRVQTVSVVDESTLAGKDVIETAWRFFVEEGAMPTMGCIMGCFGPNNDTCEKREHTGVKTG